MKCVRRKPTQSTSDIVLMAESKGTGEIFDDLRVAFGLVFAKIGSTEDSGIEVNGRLIKVQFFFYGDFKPIYSLTGTTGTSVKYYFPCFLTLIHLMY